MEFRIKYLILSLKLKTQSHYSKNMQQFIVSDIEESCSKLINLISDELNSLRVFPNSRYVLVVSYLSSVQQSGRNCKSKSPTSGISMKGIFSSSVRSKRENYSELAKVYSCPELRRFSLCVNRSEFQLNTQALLREKLNAFLDPFIMRDS